MLFCPRRNSFIPCATCNHGFFSLLILSREDLTLSSLTTTRLISTFCSLSHMPPKRPTGVGRGLLFSQAIQHIHVGVGYNSLSQSRLLADIDEPDSRQQHLNASNAAPFLRLELERLALSHSAFDFRNLKKELIDLSRTRTILLTKRDTIARMLLAALADARPESIVPAIRLSVAFCRDLEVAFLPMFEAFFVAVNLACYDERKQLVPSAERVELVFLAQVAWLRCLAPVLERQSDPTRTQADERSQEPNHASDVDSDDDEEDKNRPDIVETEVGDPLVWVQAITKLYAKLAMDSKAFIRRLALETLATLARRVPSVIHHLIEAFLSFLAEHREVVAHDQQHSPPAEISDASVAPADDDTKADDDEVEGADEADDDAEVAQQAALEDLVQDNLGILAAECVRSVKGGALTMRGIAFWSVLLRSFGLGAVDGTDGGDDADVTERKRKWGVVSVDKACQELYADCRRTPTRCQSMSLLLDAISPVLVDETSRRADALSDSSATPADVQALSSVVTCLGCVISGNHGPMIVALSTAPSTPQSVSALAQLQQSCSSILAAFVKCSRAAVCCPLATPLAAGLLSRCALPLLSTLHSSSPALSGPPTSPRRLSGGLSAQWRTAIVSDVCVPILRSLAQTAIADAGCEPGSGDAARAVIVSFVETLIDVLAQLDVRTAVTDAAGMLIATLLADLVDSAMASGPPQRGGEAEARKPESVLRIVTWIGHLVALVSRSASLFRESDRQSTSDEQTAGSAGCTASHALPKSITLQLLNISRSELEQKGAVASDAGGRLARVASICKLVQFSRMIARLAEELQAQERRNGSYALLGLCEAIVLSMFAADHSSSTWTASRVAAASSNASRLSQRQQSLQNELKGLQEQVKRLKAVATAPRALVSMGGEPQKMSAASIQLLFNAKLSSIENICETLRPPTGRGREDDSLKNEPAAPTSPQSSGTEMLAITVAAVRSALSQDGSGDALSAEGNYVAAAVALGSLLELGVRAHKRDGPSLAWSSFLDGIVNSPLLSKGEPLLERCLSCEVQDVRVASLQLMWLLDDPVSAATVVGQRMSMVALADFGKRAPVAAGDGGSHDDKRRLARTYSALLRAELADPLDTNATPEMGGIDAKRIALSELTFEALSLRHQGPINDEGVRVNMARTSFDRWRIISRAMLGLLRMRFSAIWETATVILVAVLSAPAFHREIWVSMRSDFLGILKSITVKGKPAASSPPQLREAANLDSKDGLANDIDSLCASFLRVPQQGESGAAGRRGKSSDEVSTSRSPASDMAFAKNVLTVLLPEVAAAVTHSNGASTAHHEAFVSDMVALTQGWCEAVVDTGHPLKSVGREPTLAAMALQSIVRITPQVCFGSTAGRKSALGSLSATFVTLCSSLLSYPNEELQKAACTALQWLNVPPFSNVVYFTSLTPYCAAPKQLLTHLNTTELRIDEMDVKRQATYVATAVLLALPKMMTAATSFASQQNDLKGRQLLLANKRVVEMIVQLPEDSLATVLGMVVDRLLVPASNALNTFLSPGPAGTAATDDDSDGGSIIKATLGDFMARVTTLLGVATNNQSVERGFSSPAVGLSLSSFLKVSSLVIRGASSVLFFLLDVMTVASADVVASHCAMLLPFSCLCFRLATRLSMVGTQLLGPTFRLAPAASAYASSLRKKSSIAVHMLLRASPQECFTVLSSDAAKTIQAAATTSVAARAGSDVSPFSMFLSFCSGIVENTNDWLGHVSEGAAFAATGGSLRGDDNGGCLALQLLQCFVRSEILIALLAVPALGRIAADVVRRTCRDAVDVMEGREGVLLSTYRGKRPGQLSAVAAMSVQTAVSTFSALVRHRDVKVDVSGTVVARSMLAEDMSSKQRKKHPQHTILTIADSFVRPFMSELLKLLYSLAQPSSASAPHHPDDHVAWSAVRLPPQLWANVVRCVADCSDVYSSTDNGAACVTVMDESAAGTMHDVARLCLRLLTAPGATFDVQHIDIAAQVADKVLSSLLIPERFALDEAVLRQYGDMLPRLFNSVLSPAARSFLCRIAHRITVALKLQGHAATSLAASPHQNFSTDDTTTEPSPLTTEFDILSGLDSFTDDSYTSYDWTKRFRVLHRVATILEWLRGKIAEADSVDMILPSQDSPSAVGESHPGKHSSKRLLAFKRDRADEARRRGPADEPAFGEAHLFDLSADNGGERSAKATMLFIRCVTASIMFSLRDSDASLRQLASRTLRAIVAFSASVDMCGRRAAASKTLLLDAVVRDVVLPSLRRGVVSRDPLTRCSHMAALGYLGRFYPSQYHSLSVLVATDGQHGQHEGRDNDTFFDHVASPQHKARLNALTRLRKVASDIAPRDHLRLFVPFFVCQIRDFAQGKRLDGETEDKAKGYCEAVVQTLSHVARTLPWLGYYKIVVQILQQAETEPAVRTIMVRALAKVLDHLPDMIDHAGDEKKRDLPQPEDDADVDSDQEGGVNMRPQGPVRPTDPSRLLDRITNTLQQDLMPRMMGLLCFRAITGGARKSSGGAAATGGSSAVGVGRTMADVKKTADTGGRPQSNTAADLGIAASLIKVMRYVPGGFEAHAGPILQEVVLRLRTKKEKVRDSARKILCQVARDVGPGALPYIISRMQDAFVHGYQLHVLGYTIVAVLESLKDRFVDSAKEYFVQVQQAAAAPPEDVPATIEPPVLDECRDRLFKMFADDYLGVISSQKEQSELMSTMKEVKQNRALQGFVFLAKYCVSHLFLPKFTVCLKGILSVNAHTTASSEHNSQIAKLRQAHPGASTAAATYVQPTSNSKLQQGEKGAGMDFRFYERVRLLAVRCARGMSEGIVRVTTSRDVVGSLDEYTTAILATLSSELAHNVSLRNERVAHFDLKDGRRRIRGNYEQHVDSQKLTAKEMYERTFGIASRPERVDVDFISPAVLASTTISQQKKLFRRTRHRKGKGDNEIDELDIDDPAVAAFVDAVDEFSLATVFALLKRWLGLSHVRDQGTTDGAPLGSAEVGKALTGSEHGSEAEAPPSDDDGDQESAAASDTDSSEDGDKLDKHAEELDALLPEEGGLPLVELEKASAPVRGGTTKISSAVRDSLAHLVPVVIRCLESDGSDAVTVSCLDVLQTMLAIRPPLASLSAVDEMGERLLEVTLALVNRGASIKYRALRLVACLMSQPKFPLKEAVTVKLLGIVRSEVVARSQYLSVALSVIHSIVSRCDGRTTSDASVAVLVPQVYDLIPLIVELLLQYASVSSAKSKAIAILGRFFTHFPMSRDKLRSHIDQLVRNMAYPDADGRQAVIDLLQVLIFRFPVALLREESKLLFLPLVSTFTNPNEVSFVREKALDVVTLLMVNAGLDLFAPMISKLADHTDVRFQVTAAEVNVAYIAASIVVVTRGAITSRECFNQAVTGDLSASLQRILARSDGNVDIQGMRATFVATVKSAVASIVKNVERVVTLPNSHGKTAIMSPYVGVGYFSARALELAFAFAPVDIASILPMDFIERCVAGAANPCPESPLLNVDQHPHLKAAGWRLLELFLFQYVQPCFGLLTHDTQAVREAVGDHRHVPFISRVVKSGDHSKSIICGPGEARDTALTVAKRLIRCFASDLDVDGQSRPEATALISTDPSRKALVRSVVFFSRLICANAGATRIVSEKAAGKGARTDASRQFVMFLDAVFDAVQPVLAVRNAQGWTVRCVTVLQIATTSIFAASQASGGTSPDAAQRTHVSLLRNAAVTGPVKRLTELIHICATDASRTILDLLAQVANESLRTVVDAFGGGGGSAAASNRSKSKSKRTFRERPLTEEVGEVAGDDIVHLVSSLQRSLQDHQRSSRERRTQEREFLRVKRGQSNDLHEASFNRQDRTKPVDMVVDRRRKRLRGAEN